MREHVKKWTYWDGPCLESDGNQLSSGDLVCSYIYTYPRKPKLCLYADPVKRKSMLFCC